MHRHLVGGIPSTALAAALLLGSALSAEAATGPPVHCTRNPYTGTCEVTVGTPGGQETPGSGGKGGGGAGPGCFEGVTAVPCTAPSGIWSNSMQCYLQLDNPQPPLSDPIWGGHTDGSIYWCTTGLSPSTRRVWFGGPAPVAPTPEQLARQALATLQLPKLVGHRSPTEANSDHGTPYTWVNLWTWFWADPASWTTLTARAASGGVWAQVTVTPTRLVLTPGDGSAAVTCDGPGRAWTKVDGNGAPTTGGCGYRYRHITATPITTTMTIDWAVTWTGSGSASGTLPVMTTQSSSAFAVEQIQVVTR